MTDEALAKVYVVNLTDDQSIGSQLAAMKLDHAQFDSIEAFLGNVSPSSAGCVIANLHQFGIGGVDILQQLNERQSTLPLILIAQNASTRMVVRVMREGALTLMERPVNDDELFFAIREAMQVNERRRAAHREWTKLTAQFENITHAEREVLDIVCDGLTNKEIAKALSVSVRTVEARKKRLLTKTGSNSMPQLLMAYHDYRSRREAKQQVTSTSGSYPMMRRMAG